MGCSSGGGTVLGVSQSRFASAFGTPGRRFAAHIALYPDCNARLIGDTTSEPGPQRIFIGKRRAHLGHRVYTLRRAIARRRQ